MKNTQIALANVAKFSTLQMALDVSARRSYYPPVLLGDDGRYWVPATMREATILMKAGYEAAE